MCVCVEFMEILRVHRVQLVLVAGIVNPDQQGGAGRKPPALFRVGSGTGVWVWGFGSAKPKP